MDGEVITNRSLPTPLPRYAAPLFFTLRHSAHLTPTLPTSMRFAPSHHHRCHKPMRARHQNNITTTRNLTALIKHHQVFSLAFALLPRPTTSQTARDPDPTPTQGFLPVLRRPVDSEPRDPEELGTMIKGYRKREAVAMERVHG